jgi:uncharacterized protein (DUF2147 family)
MKHILAKTAFVLLAAAIPVTASAQAALEGHWRNPKGSVIVRVAPCGNAYCGTVVEASAKAKATARKGGTPNLIGTQILSGMRSDGDGGYKGQAFDPKRNIRAPATIRMVGPDILVIKGCVLAFIRKEQRWTRIS